MIHFRLSILHIYFLGKKFQLYSFKLVAPIKFHRFCAKIRYFTNKLTSTRILLEVWLNLQPEAAL